MNYLALPNLFNNSPISSNGYWFLIVSLLRPWQSTYNRRKPSNFRPNRMGAPTGDLDGLMNPLARLVLM